LIVALEDEEGVKLLRWVLEAHACLAFAKVKRASVANADADRRDHAYGSEEIRVNWL